MPRQHNWCLFLLCILFITPSCASYSKENQSANPVALFSTGSVSTLKIPLESLKNTKVSAVDGLVFIFKDRSRFSMMPITNTASGYEGIDIRSWPEYVFGLRKTGKEPKTYISDLINTYESFVKKNIAPQEIKVFDTKKGKGYWAVGPKESMIILTHHDIDSQITVIYTKNMTESNIQKIIINGVI